MFVALLSIISLQKENVLTQENTPKIVPFFIENGEELLKYHSVSVATVEVYAVPVLIIT